ncbi:MULTISPECIES: hypothetical protein [Hyphomicrobiales]|uniref:hypothetical protein n=1 Tax=Methylobacterium sp. CCH7-A2 TaxID=1768789 RepID=UPI0012E3D8FC|nr:MULTISPECIES: hypothetical protein [Hyphomicrobiales]
MPKLDLSKLSRDLERRRRDRPEGSGPGGRAVSGAMAVVRENLAQLEALYAAGASWVDIAASLSAQGIRRGDGEALTGRQLTALIASVRRQEQRREVKAAKRAARADLPKPLARKLALASDLAPPPQAFPSDPARAEEELRRERLASLQGLFKKD